MFTCTKTKDEVENVYSAIDEKAKNNGVCYSPDIVYESSKEKKLKKAKDLYYTFANAIATSNKRNFEVLSYFLGDNSLYIEYGVKRKFYNGVYHVCRVVKYFY